MKVLNRIDKVFTYMGMLALFAIMLIIAVDGLGRQFFDKPIVGAYVLIENYLMVIMIFPLVGYTWAKRGHISVTLFITKMPKAAQNLIYLIILLMGLFFFGLITYTGFHSTLNAITSNKMTSGLIRWPLWLAYVWMPVGGASFCARMILEFIEGILKIARHGLGKVLLNENMSGHESSAD